jgi:hypothetical protein
VSAKIKPGIHAGLLDKSPASSGAFCVGRGVREQPESNPPLSFPLVSAHSTQKAPLEAGLLLKSPAWMPV